MTFALVQSVQNNSAGSPCAVTITGATPGNLLVVSIKFAVSAEASNVAVTDNASTPNAYLDAGVSGVNALGTTKQWYGVQVVGGATVVTVSWTGTSAARVTVEEFSGNAPSNASVFDKATSATSGAGTANSGAVASFSPSAAGNLIVAAYNFSTGGTATAGTNYVLGTNNTSLSTEHRLASGTSETAPMSWANTVTWGAVVGSYKPGSVATFDQTAEAATVSAASALAVAAAASITTDGATLSAASASAVSGASSITADGATLSADGAVAVVADVALTLEDAALSAEATVADVPAPETTPTRIGRGVIIKRRQKKGFTVIEPEKPARLPERAAVLAVTLEDATMVSELVMSEAPAARRRRLAVAALLS